MWNRGNKRKHASRANSAEGYSGRERERERESNSGHGAEVTSAGPEHFCHTHGDSQLRIQCDTRGMKTVGELKCMVVVEL